MVEGGSSKDFAKTKTLAFNEPAQMHALLEKLADAVAAYLSAQVASGAQALQIFDTWGGALGHSAYREFSLDYMTRIIEQLPREADGRRVPVIVFTKGGGQWLEAIAACGADAVGRITVEAGGSARILNRVTEPEAGVEDCEIGCADHSVTGGEIEYAAQAEDRDSLIELAEILGELLSTLGAEIEAIVQPEKTGS